MDACVCVCVCVCVQDHTASPPAISTAPSSHAMYSTALPPPPAETVKTVGDRLMSVFSSKLPNANAGAGAAGGGVGSSKRVVFTEDLMPSTRVIPAARFDVGVDLDRSSRHSGSHWNDRASDHNAVHRTSSNVHDDISNHGPKTLGDNSQAASTQPLPYVHQSRLSPLSGSPRSNLNSNGTSFLNPNANEEQRSSRKSVDLMHLAAGRELRHSMEVAGDGGRAMQRSDTSPFLQSVPGPRPAQHAPTKGMPLTTVSLMLPCSMQPCTHTHAARDTYKHETGILACAHITCVCVCVCSLVLVLNCPLHPASPSGQVVAAQSPEAQALQPYY